MDGMHIAALSIGLIAVVAVGCAEESVPAAGDPPPTTASVVTTIGPATTLETADGPEFIVGEIVLRNEPRSIDYSAGVPFGPGSHAVVEIRRIPRAEADGSAELMARVRIDDVDRFPIPFEIETPDTWGVRDSFGQPMYDFLPSATVFLGVADDTTYVGDLMKEVRLTIEDPSEFLEIPVAGLESCDSDRSGGFCALQIRPD